MSRGKSTYRLKLEENVEIVKPYEAASGNLVISIPKSVKDGLSLCSNQPLSIHVDGKGRIILELLKAHIKS